MNNNKKLSNQIIFESISEPQGINEARLTIKLIKESQTEQLKEFNEKQLEMYVAEKGARDYDDIQKASKKEYKEEKDSEEKIFDLDKKVREYLLGDKQVLLLLGSSGSGKSTYSQYLVHSLWSEKNNIPGIPLYVDLAAIDTPETNLMETVLRLNGIDNNGIPMLKATGRFILVLDGYDEIKTLQNLYETNRLSEWNVKAIITCCSQYFMENEEYKNRFVPYDKNGVPQWNQFEEMVMAPFDETQINEYIKKYVEKNKATLVWKDWEKYREEINKISDLIKIIDTPFLLSMVMEVLPGIVREDEKDANRRETLRLKKIDIYDAFINRWFEKEEGKLAIMRNLPEDGSDIKRAFREYSEKLAIKMLIKCKNTYNTENLNEFFYIDDEREMKKLEYIKNGVPIKSIGKGKHAFFKKSFMEYFAGEYIRHEMESKSKVQQEVVGCALNFALITNEGVLGFLAQRVDKDEKLKKNLFEIVEKSKRDPTVAIAAANAMTILNAAEVCFNGMDFKGIRIQGADLSHGLFDGTDFSRADLRGCKFIDAWLKYVKFDEADMTDIDFGELPYIRTKSEIRSITYIPYMNAIALCHNDHKVRILDVATGKKLHCLKGHTDVVNSISYGSNDNTLASASDDNTIIIWNPSTGKKLRCLKGHAAGVTSLAYSPDGETLVSASLDSTVRIWNPSTGKKFHCFDGCTNKVTSLAYSPDGKTLAFTSDDNTIIIWNTKLGRDLHYLNGHTDEVTSITYSPDSKTLASASYDGTIRIWNAITGEPLHVFNVGTRGVLCVTYSSDGTTLASANNDNTVRILESASGKQIKCFVGNTEWIRSVIYSPDDKILFSVGDDKIVRTWDFSKSKGLHCPRGHTDWVEPDLALNNELYCLRERGKGIIHSPDGKTLASVCFDNTIKISDALSHDDLYCLRGHKSNIIFMEYNLDGKTLASASDDNTVIIWDLTTYIKLYCLKVPDRVISASYNSGDKAITIKDICGSIKKWSTEKIHEEKRVTLIYSSPRSYPLSLEGASIFGVKLSELNRRLLMQKVAIAPTTLPLTLLEQENKKDMCVLI